MEILEKLQKRGIAKKVGSISDGDCLYYAIQTLWKINSNYYFEYEFFSGENAPEDNINSVNKITHNQALIMQEEPNFDFEFAE